LNNDNELSIHYSAETDQKTLLNVANHSYFNLSGNLKRDILNHTLTVKSDQFLQLNQELLPTGNLLDVHSTPFDFTAPRTIGTGVSSSYPQNVLVGNGYDHPFLLKVSHDEEIVLKDPQNGRTLTIETDEPGVVLYSGNSLCETGEIRGVPLRKHLGVCLETQRLPDAIHHPEFPSVILDKGEKYSSTTTYRFGIE
jgi:aldose 1-epimerase